MFDIQELELNMGPQHPATHGVLRLVLKIDGERIISVDPHIGYLHRGTEKLFENQSYQANIPHTDRMDYVAAATNNQAYVGAVEKLLGIEVPERAMFIRIILAELQRIASHIVWLGTHALDLGALTPFFYGFREREMILDLFEEYCGARLTLNCMRIGGLPCDVPEGWLDRVREFVELFPEKLQDYHNLLTENRIWKLRTVDVGVISPEEAIDWGLTGPPLRGSGVQWDVRRALPYEVYDRLDFEIPIGNNGDTYDRYLVRMEEMRQSNRILEQCLKLIPEGDIIAKGVKIIKPKPAEVYFSVEAPKGELGFSIVSDGSDKPYRVKVRPPCFVNLQAIETLCKGHLIADVVAVIGTLDIVLGEIDR
ncbi:MAG TPA: NADH-quinone oxidoreductase subunit D [Thermoanaerobaculia bacterium]|nr:NADH-quinone oxidoreductase subunit D [Thermoanaerobaculia bacterium]HUM29550.1 NADH-quinone oxidoreductase subunit D [Thermoanaerobaculia bacterium]HXK67933.1 NADH-quinone oxidoreductase subunit D [Thermoanaerobaculia bacterium]